MDSRSITPIVEEVYDDSVHDRSNNICHLDSLVLEHTSLTEPKIYQYMTEHPDVVLVVMNEDTQNLPNMNPHNQGRSAYSYSSQTTTSGGHSSTSYSYSSTTNGSHTYFSSSTTSTSGLEDGGHETRTFVDSSGGRGVTETYFNAGHGTYKIEFPEEEEENSSRYSFLSMKDGVEVVDLDDIIDLTSESEEFLDEDFDDDVIMID